MGADSGSSPALRAHDSGSGSGGDALMYYYDDLGTSGLSPTYRPFLSLMGRHIMGTISPWATSARKVHNSTFSLRHRRIACSPVGSAADVHHPECAIGAPVVPGDIR